MTLRVKVKRIGFGMHRAGGSVLKALGPDDAAAFCLLVQWMRSPDADTSSPMQLYRSQVVLQFLTDSG